MVGNSQVSYTSEASETWRPRGWIVYCFRYHILYDYIVTVIITIYNAYNIVYIDFKITWVLLYACCNPRGFKDAPPGRRVLSQRAQGRDWLRNGFAGIANLRRQEKPSKFQFQEEPTKEL